MKSIRECGPFLIFLLFVFCFGAEWDIWNDAQEDSHVMPPMRGTDSQQ